MSILHTNIKFYKSAIVNTSNNGEEMPNNLIVGGVIGNIFPTVSQARCLTGTPEYRKIFLKNAEDTGLLFLVSDEEPSDWPAYSTKLLTIECINKNK